MASKHADNGPSAWVQRFASLVADGEVLDLACGYGRHARVFADAGHPVLALDRDTQALASIAMTGVSTLQADLENDSYWPFEENRFSGIVIANYLHRPLFPYIFSSLAQNGLLIVETFARGNEQFGKPSNPNFLLAPGELLEIVRMHSTFALRVLAFEDGYVALPRPAMIQRICVVKLGTDNALRRFPLI